MNPLSMLKSVKFTKIKEICIINTEAKLYEKIQYCTVRWTKQNQFWNYILTWRIVNEGSKRWGGWKANSVVMIKIQYCTLNAF